MFLQGEADPVPRPDAMFMQVSGAALYSSPQLKIADSVIAKFDGRFVAMTVGMALKYGSQVHGWDAESNRRLQGQVARCLCSA